MVEGIVTAMVIISFVVFLLMCGMLLISAILEYLPDILDDLKDFNKQLKGRK